MQELKNRMEKNLERTRSQLSTIRTGRANPSLLSKIQVEYYGTKVPLSQVASVTAPENMMLLLNVFDRSAVQSVEKAITTSDLNLTPNTDGNIIRLRLPELTEERRRDLVKIVKKEIEEGRVSLRNIRRDYLETAKNQLKEKEISEDDYKKMQDDVQHIIDGYMSKLDTMLSEKESDLLKV